MHNSNTFRDPKEICDYLRSLIPMQPTPENQSVAIKLLRHKFQSVQVVAAQVLASWGKRDAVEPLWDWLIELLGNNHLIPIQVQACEALVACIGAEDIDLVLDLYFSKHGMIERSLLRENLIIPGLAKFPLTTAAARIAEDCHSSNVEDSRSSIIILGRVPFPNQHILLSALLENGGQHNHEYIKHFIQMYD